MSIKRECYRWNEKDTNILIEGYKNNESISKIIIRLNNKYSKSAILTKASKIGISKIHKWDKQELNLLKQNYHILDLDELMQIIPNRNKDAIIKMAQNLGLSSKRTWCDFEDQYILKNWKLTPDKIMAIHLNRTTRSVKCRRNYLKCYRISKNQVHYSSLNKYLRKNSNEWKYKSLKQCNYKCIITGEKFDDIHHIYSVDLMIKETLNNININYKANFQDYTQNELKIILNEYLKVQSKYPLGVCLKKNIHKYFHSLFGYGNNTIEQWNSFINNYKKWQYK